LPSARPTNAVSRRSANRANRPETHRLRRRPIKSWVYDADVSSRRAQRAVLDLGLDPIGQAPRDAPIFFHIKEGDDVLHDTEGVDHPDLEAARAEAIEGIRQIVGNAVMFGNPLRLDREMHVADDAGDTLLKFTFREVVDFNKRH
jgi:hypothetical protein